MEKNSGIARTHPPEAGGAARWRVWIQYTPLFLLALAATLLAYAPDRVPRPLTLIPGLFFVFLFPGYLLEKILLPSTREISLTRLPAFFVFSLAVWAIPATALRFLGGDWFVFRSVFVVVLWILTVGALWRSKSFSTLAPALLPVPQAREMRILTEIALGALCLFVAALVMLGARDGDDWSYLQFTQQLVGIPRLIILGPETRYTLRFAFHVWIFLQAFIGQWLGTDLVWLVREVLPVLLSPLALIAFFAWGKTFFGRVRPAALAAILQLVIYITWANADGWGRGFFARSAQDKFLVWLIVLPVALHFAWNFLRTGNGENWWGYGAAVVAGMWVHPVSLFLVVLMLAGFALFNLLSRTPFPRRRWGLLALASLPPLLTPLVIRATTGASVFTVNTMDVQAYLRISDGRLLFQPPFYITDPALVSHPLVLLALVLLLFFIPRLRSDRRVQFLWGSTLVPLALAFNPLTGRLFGELFTPWQLWRLTWTVPAGFILTEALVALPQAWRSVRESPRQAAWKLALLSVVVIVVIGLGSLNLTRSFRNLAQGHALEEALVQVLDTLRETLHAPAVVLLPRDVTRYAPAFTFNAVVLSNEAHKPEDTRGDQIDRFYDPAAHPKFLEAFLNFWKIEYAVVPNNSPQDLFLRTRAGTAQIYRNTEFTLYKTKPQPYEQ